MDSYLLQKKCVPCEGGTPPLSTSEIEKLQKELKIPWTVIENTKIRREFRFKNFKQAMQFVNDVASIAEEEQHHPDIYIFYNIVKIELWTHAIGGLSENDFILAAKIEKIQ